MKKIALILNGPIHNDARVIKTIKSLAKTNNIDLFYTKSETDDSTIFSDCQTVNIFHIKYHNSFLQKTLRHTFFYKEFDFFINYILQQEKNYDVFYCNDLPTLNVGLKLKKISKAKLIYDSHEIYLETINQFFLQNKNPIKNIIFNILIAFMRTTGYFFEKKAVKKIDKFITVNNSLAKYFAEKYKLKIIPSVIMNYPYLFEINRSNTIDYRALYHWSEEDVILIYQGNLNAGRGLNLIVDTLKQLPNKYKLIIIGEGILYDELKVKTNNLNLENRIKFLGFIENNQLLNYTAGADIGFNLLEDINKSKAMASPNKLFEYIQAEIPSVNTKTKENALIIEKYEIGVLTLNTSDAIKKAISQILETKDVYIRNCQKAKDSLNWEKQEKQLFTILKESE